MDADFEITKFLIIDATYYIDSGEIFLGAVVIGIAPHIPMGYFFKCFGASCKERK